MKLTSKKSHLHARGSRTNRARRRTYIARVYPDPFDPTAAVKMDMARRLLDRQGRPGILAKVGQTDARIAVRGYLRAPFSSRRVRKRYVASVRAMLGSSVQIRLFKR